MTATCPSLRRHGSPWAYEKYGCRCPGMVELTRTYWREASRRARLKTPRTTGAAGPGRAQHVDAVAVERATYGDPVRLTVLERSIVVQRLTAAPHKLSAAEIARRLRVSDRTVVRYRGRQLPAAA